jgi:hypothetical protein
MGRRLLAEGRDFSDLTMEEGRAASEMFGDDAPRAATALASVQAKRTPQSTSPDAVRKALVVTIRYVDDFRNFDKAKYTDLGDFVVLTQPKPKSGGVIRDIPDIMKQGG